MDTIYMSNELRSFLQLLATEKGWKRRDLIVALLWFDSSRPETIGIGFKFIITELEAILHAKQNVTQIKKYLKADRRVVKAGKDLYKINPRYKVKLDDQFSPYLSVRPIKSTSSILDMSMFKKARGYIKKVVLQLNSSYDFSLFDCTAVMCRRLLETLIIEIYEYLNRLDEIKGSDGHFSTLSELTNHILKDNTISLSRNTKQGLRGFKTLGDLSAHNRRFNARKPDIDRIKDGFRVAAEELLYLANQGPQ